MFPIKQGHQVAMFDLQFVVNAGCKVMEDAVGGVLGGCSVGGGLGGVVCLILIWLPWEFFLK